jgi:hypothetical protein
MSYGSGQTVLGNDFNSFVHFIENIYSVGSGDHGYGQADLNLADVLAGVKPITAQEWSLLARMIATCGGQTGTDLTGLYAPPSTLMRIKAGTALQPVLQTIDLNRLVAVTDSRSVYPSVATVTQTNSWNGVIEATATIDFKSEDNARYFFNSGGEIRINFTHPNGNDNTNTSFRALVQDFVGSVAISAHKVRVISSSRTVEQASGFYEFTAAEAAIVDVDNIGSSYSAGAPDNVSVYAYRAGAEGVRGGNGSKIVLRIHLSCLGDASGSVVSAGTTLRFDILKADTRLNGIATPDLSITGFTLISTGNRGPTTPPTAQTPGATGQAHYPASASPADFVVPQYSILKFDLKAAGGNEGSSLGAQPRPINANPLFSPAGLAGTDASVSPLGIRATGGGGGGVYNAVTNVPGATGALGSGVGGDINMIGGGGAGGRDKYAVDHPDWKNGGPGGAGGRLVRTYIRGAQGAPIPGQVLQITSPLASAIPAAPSGSYDYYPGNQGAAGDVMITWVQTGAGSIAYNTPGSFQFTVPEYTTIGFELAGAGGGEGGLVTEDTYHYPIGPGRTNPMIAGTDGESGGAARLTGLSGWEPIAYGGSGGSTSLLPGGFTWAKLPGAHGSAVGGDIGSADGAGAKGGAGGWMATWGNAPGVQDLDGGPGGNGALVRRSFSRGAPGSPIPGQTLTLSVPAGGNQGYFNFTADQIAAGPTLSMANPGQNGWIKINWS